MTHDPETAVRDAFAGVTFERTLTQVAVGARRRRVRRRIAAGAVPAIALVAAGGTALLTSDKISATNVACYGSADPAQLPFGAHSPQTTGASAEKLCAKEWRAGYLPFEPILDRRDAPFPVPPLTACTVEGGGIGVFPTGDAAFCTRGPVARAMGLSEVPDDYDEHVERYIALREDATRRLRAAAVGDGDPERACLDVAAVRDVVQGVLADHGYDGWSITIEHSRTDAPCWMHVNFDNVGREVVVYSTERGVREIWVNDAAAFPEG